MPITGTLRSRLNYEPQEMRFGTSGRRGEIRHLTQLEIYINVLAELRYFQGLPREQGGIVRGEQIFLACDLRPSSCSLDPETGRGRIAQAAVRAIRDGGMIPVNLGAIPTPALSYYALVRGRGSVMITGSHIPFDRNGYKFNTSCGELLKEHEAAVNAMVRRVREEIYERPFEDSPFDANGMLKADELPSPIRDAADEYVKRYTDFFSDCSLEGLQVLAYQHSAVGRDLLVEILRALGAEVVPAGRSEVFVPIDTENIGEGQLAVIQKLADQAGRLDAVVSTDGDSDRPLVLGVDEQSHKLRFFGGDLVGMIAAEYLNADAVVVPISCNDSIDRSSLASKLEPKTRIGSPFVIAGMESARSRGCKVVCGWEANGGFLLGSHLARNGKTLHALPTRDAMLPILCTLFSAREKSLRLTELFDRVLCRYSRAALLPDFPRSASVAMLTALTPAPEIRELVFEPEQTIALDSSCKPMSVSGERTRHFAEIRKQLESFFRLEEGFGPVARVNYTDGVRITFRNGEVAHMRPSGNADELRIYAVADSQERADQMAVLGVRVPDGILMQMRRALADQVTS
jgi:phosphomannomutase